MVKTKRRFNEDDVVWFVDACFNKVGVEEFFAQRGRVIGFRKNGDLIVSFFGGWFIFDASQVFATKEECEESLYISKIANDMKDNNPTDVNIFTRVDLIDTSANFNENQKVIDELEKLRMQLVFWGHNPAKCLSKDDAIEDFEELIDNRIKELESQNKKLNAENQQLFERLIELEGEKK